jgi:FAD/FMN-containing dehydrogenase
MKANAALAKIRANALGSSMINRRVFLGSVAAVGAAATTAGARTDDPRSGALSGKIYFKTDPRYEALREAATFNARKPNRFPNAIVLATEQADVIAAVNLASQRGWQVSVRSGGHSWTGSHTRDHAIQINLARMQEISIDAQAKIAKISPSVSGNTLNKKLREEYGLFTPSAHGVNVGMGGFMMCGGHGWNSRQFGLGCENLLALDLVTADGKLIHASETENSDYLWAARGSGPGFFGAATRYYVRLHERPPVTKSSGVLYPLDQLEPALNWFIDALPSFPRNLEVVFIVTTRDGTPAITLAGTCLGASDQEVEATLAVMDTCPNLNTAISKWSNRDRVVPVDVQQPTEIQPTGARFAVDNIWTNASAAQLIPHLRELWAQMPTSTCSLFLQAWGPVRALPDMAYSVQANLYIALNGTYYDPADDVRVAQWVLAGARRMDSISAGAQMNDENMQSRPARYLSPEAARRLEAMHRQHDPKRRFPGFLSA